MNKIRIFLTQTMHDAKKQNTKVQKIIDEFTVYKETKNPGQMFGRDADFNRPTPAVETELHHLHLLDVTASKHARQKMLDKKCSTKNARPVP